MPLRFLPLFLSLMLHFCIMYHLYRIYHQSVPHSARPHRPAGEPGGTGNRLQAYGVDAFDLRPFLAPGDRPFATLELHNVEGKPGAYTAQAFSTNGLKVTFRKVFQLILGQRIAEKIPFLAPDVTGIGKIGFKVAGPESVDFGYGSALAAPPTPSSRRRPRSPRR